MKNGSETDVDCGGSCAACGLGKSCQADGDCLSDFCNFGRCDRPTCSDGIKNQGESDVDCGGPHCPACADRKACTAAADCASMRCDGSTCASCHDGVQSGGELAVDCGGPCPPCADGTPCTSGAQCGGGQCVNQRCCTPNRCGFCGPLPAETCNGVDDDCDGIIDNPDEIGPPPACPLQLGVCDGAVSHCGGRAGWVCDAGDYTAHNPAYSPTELPCDGLDNNCDGAIDEVSCPATGNPCTQNACQGTSCVVSNRNTGLPCPSGAADPNFAPLYYCKAGVCQQAVEACDAELDAQGTVTDFYARYKLEVDGTLNSDLHCKPHDSSCSACLCGGSMSFDDGTACNGGCAEAIDWSGWYHVCFTN
jgi:hypothetical protein